VSALTEQAVTSGWSVKTLAERIHALDTKMTTGKANFIARDQIGKLNGHITQRRMESVGLTMYIWETSGDERVRPSHEMMDGGLCRWDDSTVYSDDGGKTWIPRPSGSVLLHPGIDIMCRCTATSYWDELVGEADSVISKEEGDEIVKPFVVQENNIPLSKEYEDAFVTGDKQMNKLVRETYGKMSEESRKLLNSVLREKGMLEILPEDSLEPNSWLNGKIRLKKSVIEVWMNGGENPLLHELGHMLDERLTEILGKYSISNGNKKKWDNLYNVFAGDWFDLIKKHGGVDDVRVYVKDLAIKDPYKYDAISDMIGGLSGRPIQGTFGHSGEYWDNVFLNPQAKEGYAHLFVAKNTSEKSKIMQDIFPKSISWYNKVEKILIRELEKNDN
jgi:SPP1 gp7 family putative phage head morphogenesis protein